MSESPGVGVERDTTDHRALCRCCNALCGILVTTRGEQVLDVRGDPDHPVSQGYTCPKGRQYASLHHSPSRLSYPMVRGERVSWDECLDDLASGFSQLLDEGGPDRLGCYLGTGLASDSIGWPLTGRFFQLLGSRQRYSAVTVDNAPLFRAAELISGFHNLRPVWKPEDREPRLLILIGFNPVVSHGYVNFPNFGDPVRRLRGYRARGGEVWVIDPRRSETASLADRHLAPRPGADAMILAWLVRELLRDGADASEIATACQPADLERLREAVEPFELDRIATAAGLEPTALTELLRAIRRTGQIAVATGTGLGFGPHGVVAEWLRWALLIVTGSLDRPGGMAFARPKFSSTDAFEKPAPPEGSVQPGPASRPELTGLFGERPSAAITDEIESGELTGFFIVGGNPITALPNPDRTRAALRQLRLCVVVDTFHNELTELATHALPVPWHLERADVSFYSRNEFFSPAVIRPGGERKPLWWILAELASRLRLDLLDSAVDLGTADDETIMRCMGLYPADGLDRVIAAGSHGTAFPPSFGWVHDRVLPGGRWRIAPRVLVDRLPEVWGTVDGSLRFVSNRRVHNTNSVAYGKPPIHDDGPPAIEVSPFDAVATGVIDGDRIRIVSDHGHVDGTARIDARVRNGVVTMNHGWSQRNVARLTDEVGIDPLTGQPVQSAIPVRIERLPADS